MKVVSSQFEACLPSYREKEHFMWLFYPNLTTFSRLPISQEIGIENTILDSILIRSIIYQINKKNLSTFNLIFELFNAKCEAND